MQILFATLALIAVALLARDAHRRAAPPPQVHSPAKRGPDHDLAAVAASGMEGYSMK